MLVAGKLTPAADIYSFGIMSECRGPANMIPQLAWYVEFAPHDRNSLNFTWC